MKGQAEGGRDLEAIAKRVVLSRSFFQIVVEMNCSDIGFSTKDLLAFLPWPGGLR